MELFHRAKTIRLRSHHDKYLLADDDGESVNQERKGASKRARWSVEFVEDSNVLRLRSCYGKYLTASNSQFLLGVTGKKVIQTIPKRLDSSVEWEPIREGSLVRLRTRYGHFLRANGGLPPLRNSITHDIPHRTSHKDWVLWEVDIVEIQVDPPRQLPLVDSQASEAALGLMTTEMMSTNISKLESSDSFTMGSPPKTDGRSIYFMIGDDRGNVDSDSEELFFTFKGASVEELTHKLVEETGLEDIVVCSRNPLNGMLYPLRLHLPPNNVTMHIVVVRSSSEDTRRGICAVLLSAEKLPRQDIGKPGALYDVFGAATIRPWESSLSCVISAGESGSPLFGGRKAGSVEEETPGFLFHGQHQTPRRSLDSCLREFHLFTRPYLKPISGYKCKNKLCDASPEILRNSVRKIHK